MSGQPFEIASPVEHFIESRLNEKDADKHCAEKRGKISAKFFKLHLFL
jgi:hypothetical protein